MNTRILYQFPISHYCEKSRWQLDRKGLSFQVRNWLPGPHRLRSQWLARINTVPILRDGGRVIGDSTRIAYYLEKYYPEAPLIPDDPDQRGRVIELEQQMDRYGVHVRRWIYAQVLNRPEVSEALFGAGLPALFKRGLVPMMLRVIRRQYRIEPGAVVYSEQRIREALEQVESLLARSGGDYLVGDRLTLADITAASMLGPLMGAPKSPWNLLDRGTLPEVVEKQFEQLRRRPAGQWVLERYRTDR